MDTIIDALLERADNELMIAEKLKILSEEKGIKDLLKIPESMTFYSSVISHAD